MTTSKSTTTRRAAVTPNRHGSAHVEFPNDLDEHVRKWFAPYGEKVTVCSIDLRVGGDYHIIFVTEDGTGCSFRGTESTELHEARGVTKLTQRLAFRDKAGRDHMTKTDGFEASYDNVEDLLRSLLDPKETVSG
jgi:hypothetical protein